MSNRRRLQVRQRSRDGQVTFMTLLVRLRGYRPTVRLPRWRGRVWTGIFAAAVVVGSASFAVANAGGTSGETAYRITYRVTDATQHPPVVSTVVLDVRRPLFAAQITRAGAPPGQTVTSAMVEENGFVELSQRDGQLVGQRLQPDTATMPDLDLRLRLSLEAAARTGMVARAGTERVAGRRCMDYLSHDPLEDGEWAKPTRDSRVTTCVDSAGHMLRDVWYLNDKLVRERVAVEFQEHPRPLPDPLAGVTTTDAAQTSGVTSAPLSDKVAFLTAIPSAPHGMRRVDARLVGTADPTTGALVGLARRLLFSDGSDYVEVTEQRSSMDNPSPPAGPGVQLPHLGVGHLSDTPNGFMVSVLLDNDTLLQVRGSISEHALLAYAGQIRRLRAAASSPPEQAPTQAPTP